MIPLMKNNVHHNLSCFLWSNAAKLKDLEKCANLSYSSLQSTSSQPRYGPQQFTYTTLYILTDLLNTGTTTPLISPEYLYTICCILPFACSVIQQQYTSTGNRRTPEN